MIDAMITGAHVILYTPEAEALRELFRDVLGWPHVDAGDCWLIFAMPPAELAAHPAAEAKHELLFLCDDVVATVTRLRSHGVEVRGELEDRGWGISTTLVLPGGVEVLLYEPRHPVAAGSS